MQIANEMRQDEQRFPFVGDLEWRRRRPIEQNRYRGGNGGSDVMIIGALKISVKMIALDGHVGEMIGVVTSHLFLILVVVIVFSLRQIAALKEVPLHILLHDRVRLGERLARFFKFGSIT